jgi:hypothetical protein
VHQLFTRYLIRGKRGKGDLNFAEETATRIMENTIKELANASGSVPGNGTTVTLPLPILGKGALS